MKHKGVLLALVLAGATLAFVLIGCATATENTESNAKKDPASQAEYRRITPQEAKTFMDGGEPSVVLDVRTSDEYEQGHIEGALLIPMDQLASKASTELPNKEEIILVYCRSGNRSATAARELISQGYTNVFDFGGINNWPYDVIKN